MAKEKKKKVKVDPNIVDYYALYHLTRGADSKELLKQLRKKQGEIKQMMSAGALNGEEVMEKLMEQDKLVTAAIRIFKSEEKIAEYNAQLDAAVASGTLDTAAQEAAESALAEIERLFLNGNYGAVIKRCKASLLENGANAKIYNWLAQSYFMSGQTDASIATVDEFASAFPNDLSALDMGVRYYILGRNDVNKSQEFMNRMIEQFDGESITILDQSYIHLAQNNLDMAFQLIDSYLEEHPADHDFRRSAAFDIIGFCALLYKRVEGSDAAFLTSAEDYDRCKKLTDKASAIYHDKTIQEYVDYTNYMGQVEFNHDNANNMKWTAIAAFLYGCAGFVCVGENVLGGLFVLLLAGLCVYVDVMLYKVSRRPYWQIYKYELTGEREPREQLFITIGNVVAGYMRWSWKMAWTVIRLAFSLAGG